MPEPHDLTPSQTVGPYLSLPAARSDVGAASIRISGVLTDGAGQPVPDGMIETWQADAAGRFDRADAAGRREVRGFCRCLTDANGRFQIVTVKPGATGDGQAPHIDVSVLARGLLARLVTRLYFPDESAANATDPVLAQVPPHRRGTLLAVPAGPGALRFDIRLQGEGETVFLTV